MSAQHEEPHRFGSSGLCTAARALGRGGILALASIRCREANAVSMADP